jgi:hypothetical protein
MIQEPVEDTALSVRRLVILQDDAEIEWLFCLASALQAWQQIPLELLPGDSCADARAQISH